MAHQRLHRQLLGAFYGSFDGQAFVRFHRLDQSPDSQWDFPHPDRVGTRRIHQTGQFHGCIPRDAINCPLVKDLDYLPFERFC